MKGQHEVQKAGMEIADINKEYCHKLQRLLLGFLPEIVLKLTCAL